jgi:uncharacterized protein with PIN domain
MIIDTSAIIAILRAEPEALAASARPLPASGFAQ